MKSCPSVPRYYGTTLSLTLLYPANCGIPLGLQLYGNQRAIMPEHFSGAQMLLVENITTESAEKALEALKLIHDHQLFIPILTTANSYGMPWF